MPRNSNINLQNKLTTLIKQLSEGLVQREDIIKTALLSLMAGENLLLIGPPGTAKSLLARRVSEVLVEDKQSNSHLFFEYLLTKFSTPEEIFGSLSLTELKKDNFHRKTAGYLPTAQVGFLDEIFKASSSILNTLLTILNERRFHNGTQVENVNLQTLIGASNELPNEQSELSALYDRFLLRKYVDYVDSGNLNQLFDLPPKAEIQEADKLTTEELNNLRKQAQSVKFPDEVRQAIEQIWAKHKDTFKEDSDEYLSDRRFIKLLHILRISAVTNGRNEVDFSDVLLLKDALWNNANNIEKVMDLVKEVLKQFDRAIILDGQSNNAQPKKTSTTVSQPINNSAPEGSVIKGLKGSGTESDPFLIENTHHLCRLTEEKVGKQGYYFKQTADIDCSELDDWIEINFIGNYSGNHYEIIHKEYKYLFNRVKNSEIKHLGINGLQFIRNCDNSTIIDCISLEGKCDKFFINSINNSNIKYCDSSTLMFSYGINCSSIEYCKSNTFFSRREIKNSTVSNCLITILENHNNGQCFGSVTEILIDSQIEMIFIKGNIELPEKYFSTIVWNSDNSVIKKCVVGSIAVRGNHNSHTTVHKSNSVLEHNTILSSNRYFDEEDRRGYRIDLDYFNQYYLENTLGWDFNSVWQWDDTENIPVLQPMPDNFGQEKTEIELADNQVSLLTHQLKHNIWL